MGIEFIGKSLLINNTVLVIGDLHLGYEGSLHKSGILVKADLYKQTIEDLNKIFEYIKNNYDKLRFGVEESNGEKSKITKREKKINDKIIDKIIILGDLKHEFGSILREEWEEVLDLISYLKEKIKKKGEIIIVEGNHDFFTDKVIRKKGIEMVDYFIWKEFAFLHGDRDFPENQRFSVSSISKKRREIADKGIYDKRIKYWIMGHGHPAIVLEEKRGVKREKYKCFLVGKFKDKKIIIVPSFFPLQEGTDVKSYELGLAWNFDFGKFGVKVINTGNLDVLDFGELGEI